MKKSFMFHSKDEDTGIFRICYVIDGEEIEWFECTRMGTVISHEIFSQSVLDWVKVEKNYPKENKILLEMSLYKAIEKWEAMP
jgi:hypothetical protein